MSFFFKGKEVEIVLFSPLEGKITNKGRPVVNATIKLWIAWKDKEGETTTYHTDDQGNFSIPVKIVTYKESPLAQLSVAQKIIVVVDGNETIIWKAGKSSSHLFGELGGQPNELVCELTKNEMTAHLDHALLETLCEWKNIKKLEN